MSSLVAVAVSMHVRCAKCSSSIHMGALVDRARCTACANVESLPPSRWREILDAAVNDAPRSTRSDGEEPRDVSEAWIVAGRAELQCTTCKAPLPKTAAENVKRHGRCFCVSCGAKLSVRTVPPELAPVLPQITHLIGEDIAQLRRPDAPPPDVARSVVVDCPECGGKISPDGSSRAVRCPYCSVAVVLHQAVWNRFAAGRSEKHAFYLLHDPSVPRPLGRADVQWSSVDAVVCDAMGHLYGIGTSDGFGDDCIVFALDPQLRTLWVRTNLPIADDARLTLRGDGVLFAWSPRRHSALALRARDGEDLGKVGMQQPAGHRAHVLDLERAEDLAIDVDGTFILSKRERLVRCAPDGTALRMWPARGGVFGGLFDEKIRPFTDTDEEDAPSIESVGDQPTTVRDAKVKVGPDGRVYLHDGNYVVALDRTGKKLYTAELPDGSSQIDFDADARGNVYVVRRVSRDTNAIFRVTPDGRAAVFVDGRNPATPIRDDRRIAVRGDGAVFLFDYGRSIRVIGPDGRMLHRSERAEKDDADFARSERDRRDRDEPD